MKFKKGFTLVELLVVLGILSVMFGLVLTIFTRVLQGGNKTQVIGAIKQNGQSMLEIMDKTIRDASRVVCTSVLGDSIAVVQEGVYTKFKFSPPTPTSNGSIKKESFSLPLSPPPNSDPNLYIRDFESTICTNPLTGSAQFISDTNLQTGASVNCYLTGGVADCNNHPIFRRIREAGFKDQVSIKFGVKPGISSPSSVTGEIDDINFQTTIDIR